MNATTVRRQTQTHAAAGAETQPALSCFVVPDDSLAPNLNAGDWLQVQNCDTAEVGNVVIVQTPDGKRWIRRLVRGDDGIVRAATNWGSADWTDYKVIARAVRRWVHGSSI